MSESEVKFEYNPRLLNPERVTVNVKYQTVAPEDEEYQKIVNAEGRSFLKMIKIISFEKIHNPYLENKYQKIKRKKPHCQELYLFHGTHSANSDSIVKYNLNWRFCKDPSYGFGVYFAKYPGFAGIFPNSKTENEEQRVMLVFKVLVGKTCPGRYRMEYPTDGCDTAVAYWYRGKEEEATQYLKFDDHEFVPIYKICYTNKKPLLNFTEPMGSLETENGTETVDITETLEASPTNN